MSDQQLTMCKVQEWYKCKYSMIMYFFLNDECAIVNSIARLSLLNMNWIVCTLLTIIQLEISFSDILIFLTTKRGETSVFCRKTILVLDRLQQGFLASQNLGTLWCVALFPVNFLLIENLQRFDYFYGEELKVQCPTGSGNYMRLSDVAKELSSRLISLFIPDVYGYRPCHGRLLQFHQHIYREV